MQREQEKNHKGCRIGGNSPSHTEAGYVSRESALDQITIGAITRFLREFWIFSIIIFRKDLKIGNHPSN
jgi:hypothetical protein